jgi:uncharacterized protein (UPF0210 family)
MPFKGPILEKGQIIPDLGEKMKEFRETALDSFDKNASRYMQTVYLKKRAEMLAKLNSQLGVYFVGQVNNLHKKALYMYDEQLQEELKKPNYNFSDVVSSCIKIAESYFVDGAKGKKKKEREEKYIYFIYLIFEI